MSRLSLLGVGGPLAPSLALDGLSPTGAWSVRKLRTAYAGACLRVRRSSDNTESDIGFSSNELDTSALLSFVGAGDGFVVRWYDQSGNSRDLPQTTSTQQPKIVASGALVLGPGSKPTLDFDGSNDVLQSSIAISNLITASAYAAHAVFCPDTLPTTGSGAMFGPFIFAGGANRYFAYAAWNSSVAVYNWDGNNDTLANAATAGTNYLGQCRHEGGSLYNQLNSGSEQSLASGNTSVLTDSFQVGGGSIVYDGKISEVVTFSAVPDSGSRAALAANTSSYFSLP